MTSSRAVRAAAVLGIMLVAGCGGCGNTSSAISARGPAEGIPPAPGQAVSGRAGEAARVRAQRAAPGPSRGAAGLAAPAALRLCRRPPGPALRADLSRAVALSRRGEIVPLGASAAGATAYVSAWVPGFAGVAALRLATGRLRPVLRFARPATDQADGAASGQWLVFAETFSLSSLDRFTLYAWNAVSGRRRVLGRSLAGPGGTPWPSPWHVPAVSGHYAAWAQGYGPGGLVEIRLADLATGRVTTIRRGHVQPPFFDGSLVVWPESDHPGTQTRLHAWSLSSHRQAALPPVLAAVHGTEFVTAAGTRTAYLSPDLTRLYYSASPRTAARPVLRLPAGETFSALSLGRGSLTWTTTTATYLASTRTGGYARVTPRYGYATTGGPLTLVSDPPAGKAGHPALDLHVVKPPAVRLAGCG